MTTPVLWYVADPMCSWCWGFAPVISAIAETYKDRLQIGLLMGGLRPGTTEPVTPRFREEILHHWHDVNKRTGQPFKFEGAMPDGFVYDTEPPSRAVIAVGEIDPAAMLPYFRLIQHAFYAEGRDVTQPDTLAELTQRIPFAQDARSKFLEIFHAEETKQHTLEHFRRTQKSGITGFPTAVLQDDSGAELLTAGYRPFEALRPEIDNWLANRDSV